MSKDLINLSILARLKFLFKDSIVYGAASAISKAFGLITFPIIARNLSIADFGFYDYLISVLVFFTIIVQFGQDSSIARFYYEYENKLKRQKFISQSLFFQIFCFLIILLIFSIFPDEIKKILFFDRKEENLIFFLVLNIPFQLFISFSQNILRWSFKRSEFLFMSLGYTFFQTIFIMFLLYFDKMSVINLFKAYISLNIIFSLLGIFLIRQYIIIIKDFKGFKEILFFALPFGIIGVLASLSATVERNLSHSIFGEDALGFYAAAFKISILISLLVNAFHVSWGPFSMSIYKDKNVVETYNLILKVFSLIILISTLILTIISPLIIELLASSKYLSIVNLIFPLTLACGIRGISWITEIGISLSKKTYLSLISHSVQFLVTILLIYFFSSYFGLISIALSVLIGQLTRSIIESYYAQKTYPLKWDYNPVIKMISLTIIFGIISEIIRIFHGDFYSLSSYFIGLLLLIYFGFNFLFSENELKKINEAKRNFILSIKK
tara:strand:- start:3459 stop:4949 length:1491 start_codon:yes stop_codon:yes gene_type:complete